MEVPFGPNHFVLKRVVSAVTVPKGDNVEAIRHRIPATRTSLGRGAGTQTALMASFAGVRRIEAREVRDFVMAGCVES